MNCGRMGAYFKGLFGSLDNDDLQAINEKLESLSDFSEDFYHSFDEQLTVVNYKFTLNFKF